MHYNSIARVRAISKWAPTVSLYGRGGALAMLLAITGLVGCQSTTEPYIAKNGQPGATQGADNGLAWSNIQGRPSASQRQNNQQSRTGLALTAALASSKAQSVRRTDYVEGAPAAPGDVAVLSPMVVGAHPAELQSPVVVGSGGYDGGEVIVLQPYGVGRDQAGLADNISARVGATYYSVDNTATPGGVAILEGSKQLGDSAFFVHAGAGTEYLDGEWPVSASIGLSRLATIIDGEVVKPLIFDASYDLYWDSEFFGTDDTVFIDQVRVLGGYALSARLDAGVWAAIGLQSDSGWRPVPGGRMQVRTDFADRIAGYVAAHVGSLGSQVILSAGWEDNPGNYFMEGNTFVPLTQNVNFWGGGGYSDSGSYDVVAGLELMLGRKGRASAGYDACGDVCSAPTYRGGWANGTYRGAQRVVTPSRARRMLADPSWAFIPDPTTGPVDSTGGQLDPPVVNTPLDPPVIDPPVIDPPVINPPDQNTNDPVEDCLPRVTDRPTRESNLSRFLQSLQDPSL